MIFLLFYDSSPQVKESNTNLDSGFYAVDSGFQVLDSESLDSGFQSLIGFEIPGFRILKENIFRIPLYEAIGLRSIREKFLENCCHKETAARMENTINDVLNSSYHS